jgi:hypothetical protein
MQVGSTDSYARGFDALFGGPPAKRLPTTLPKVIHTLRVRNGHYWVNGVEVTKETYERAVALLPEPEGAGQAAMHGRRLSNQELQYSDSMGVHPDEIPEAMAEAQKRGLNVEFDQEGTCVFRSYRDFDRYTKEMGYHNRKWFK